MPVAGYVLPPNSCRAIHWRVSFLFQQGGYSSSQVTASNVTDPYMNYYGWGMPYASQVMPGNLWGNRNTAYNYGALTPEYVHSTALFGQYDYVDWYPGLDQGAATWGQPVLPVHKSNDYLNGSYYNAVGGSGAGSLAENAFNSDADGSNGAMSAVEQSFKGMQVVEDDERGSAGLYSGKSLGSVGAVAPKKSWANIASQPARNAVPRGKGIIRAPVLMTKQQGLDGSSAWDTKAPSMKGSQGRSGGDSGEVGGPGSYDIGSQQGSSGTYADDGTGGGSGKSESSSGGQYNPKDFDLNPKAARYFVIKSFSEDDIHRSIKYGIWCSTEYGNKRLDSAFHERSGKGPVYLFFSVNGSGHFCGMAQMTSAVDYHSSANVWAQDKWKGQFSVQWIYVKDVPNSQLRHIKLENNENKPVTNSRDTQEIPCEKGKSVLRIIHQYRHTTSIFDDFNHYEKQQAESTAKKGTTRLLSSPFNCIFTSITLHYFLG